MFGNSAGAVNLTTDSFSASSKYGVFRVSEKYFLSVFEKKGLSIFEREKNTGNSKLNSKSSTTCVYHFLHYFDAIPCFIGIPFKV